MSTNCFVSSSTSSHVKRDPLYFLNSKVQDRKKKNISFLYNAMANPYISIKGNFVKINPS
jgi:hypothetical protein